jgi:hypothetical protein
LARGRATGELNSPRDRSGADEQHPLEHHDIFAELAQRWRRLAYKTRLLKAISQMYVTSEELTSPCTHRAWEWHRPAQT